eukprot:4921463-Prymnesium_polylepis.1
MRSSPPGWPPRQTRSFSSTYSVSKLPETAGRSGDGISYCVSNGMRPPSAPASSGPSERRTVSSSSRT